ncbi:gramicidin S synthetase 1 [Metarhizium guizhouense ARSEF 977]|uniref:Gramicidin S synthetase 1 n=1 Tax=Metarhizium guizhouense (strain ARSEF 977) TaxID=1276136 RepID=A0A0B4GZP5_METGA|nr:gramicidin S synthetase 1 [Metarhizium guizhouense ARSEF 977]
MARVLAMQLIQRGLGYEEPIGILATYGSHQIIAQVAIIYMGGTCVPLDPDRAQSDMQTQLQVAGVKNMIVDDAFQHRHLPVTKIPLLQSPDGRHTAGNAAALPVATKADFRSHIFFTSGTTGTPKAVEILARGIVRLARDPVYGPRSSDIVGHLNNPCFDPSLIDIWTSLLNGSTIAALDRREALLPKSLDRMLKENHVTYLLMPTAIFHIVAPVCPTTFSECHTVMIGGESPDLKACEMVLDSDGPPTRLINAYGPTECSIMALAHVITSEDTKRGYLPIGKPVNETCALVLNESYDPVMGQEKGELFLGGQGLARGYLNNPDATAKAFLHVRQPESNGKAVRMYHTRDSVYSDATGNIVWLGRNDRVVKVKGGYRVNLDAIETELLSTDLVHAAVAMKIIPPGAKSSILVACVAFTSSHSDSSSLLALIRSRLPSYMVPQIVSFDTLPLTPNGKVDKRATTRRLMDMLQEATHIDNELDPDMYTQTERALKKLWLQSLHVVPRASIHPDADFFTLGATSLEVAVLISGIHQVFRVMLSAHTIYKVPRLGDLATCIDDMVAAGSTRDNEATTQALLADASQWRHISIPTTPPINWLDKDEGNVFLTGATGFVGAHLLVDLLQCPQVRSVCCLVRSDSHASARKKMCRNLEKYHLEHLATEFESKIKTLLGDFSKPRLGLSEPAFLALAESTSVVFHLGAQINYNEPYLANRAANMMGVLNMIRLAVASRPKALHYASSMAAFGPTGLVADRVGELTEDTPLQPYLDATVAYETGYGQSQWVSDEMLCQLMKRGFPAAVYRMGAVVCNGKDGVGNPDDFMSRLTADCFRLGIYPHLPDQRKEMVAVDYVAPAMRMMAMSNRNLGKVYHLTPGVRENISVNEYFRIAQQHTGIVLSALAYGDWVHALVQADKSGVELGLKPLFPMLMEKVKNNRTRWELYEGMAMFNNDKTVAALKTSEHFQSLRPAPISPKDLHAYFDNILSRG